jgi:hypothetical protein
LHLKEVGNCETALSDDRVNPSDWDNDAIQGASQNGHWKL